MKVLHRIGRFLAGTAAIISFAAVLGSCAERDFSENIGDNLGSSDQKEAYTKAFIEEFGLFKGRPYSAAVSGAISVRTASPTAINVFADVDGQRYLFASLGAVNGIQSVKVTIPSEVSELIVTADGEEHKVKLGEVLDLTKNTSRYSIEPEFVDEIPSLDGFDIVRMPGQYREIGLAGSMLQEGWLRYNVSDGYRFHIFDAEHNFKDVVDKLMLPFSWFYCDKEEKSQFTIYPLYWRENVYGESDYLLGIYYYDTDIRYSYTPNHIKMIDLEDFDLKSAITVKKNGEDEYTVSQGSQSYDVSTLSKRDSVHMKGYHMKMKNVKTKGENGSARARIGFYIKSGLQEGSTPGKGRNYTHITFQNGMFNAKEWGDDNYWDATLKEGANCYNGAVMTKGSQTTLPKHRPIRVDKVEESALGTSESIYYVIGFGSQPNGAMAPISDFSDVVLAMTSQSFTTGHEVATAGETYPTYPWILAAEDMGSVEDWDFNDVVFTIYDLTTDFTREYVSSRGYFPTPTIQGRRITVVPRAVGGILPIYLMYEGEVSMDATDESVFSAINSQFTYGTYVVGTEVHAWLGEPDYTRILNTGENEGYTGCAVSFCVPLNDPDEEEFNPYNPPQTIMPKDNSTLRKFWVLVDRSDNTRDELFNPDFDRTPLQPEFTDKTQTAVRRHASQYVNVLKPFSGKIGEGAWKVYPPSDTRDEVPQMLMCNGRWRWPKERARIDEAYTSFRDWVKGLRSTWHSSGPIEEGLNGYHEEMLCDPIEVVWMQ